MQIFNNKESIINTDVIHNKYSSYSVWFFLTLFVVFVIPVPPQIFGFVGEGVAFLFCLAVLLLFLFLNKKKLYIPAVIICCILFFLLVGSIFRDINYVIRSDFLELLRPVFWLTIFSLFYGVLGNKNASLTLEHLMKFVLFIAVWGILEVILPLPSVYYDLYRLDGSVYDGKAITSFIAPYSYAAVTGMGAIFFFACSKIYNKKINLFYFCICITSILLSQSKSGIFGVFFALLLMQLFSGRIFGLIILGCFAVSIIFIILFSNYFNYVSQFLNAVYSAFEIGGISTLAAASPSIGNRILQLQEMYSYLDTFFLFGRGIGKDYLYLESSFALILFRYGLSGIFIIFVIFISTVQRTKAYSINCIHRNFLALKHSILYIFIFLAIVSASANVIDQFKVAFVYVGILGLIFSYSPKVNEREF